MKDASEQFINRRKTRRICEGKDSDDTTVLFATNLTSAKEELLLRCPTITPPSQTKIEENDYLKLTSQPVPSYDDYDDLVIQSDYC